VEERPLSAVRRPRLDALAVLLLLACTGVWGLGQVAAKLTLAEVPPLLQAGLRSLGAALLLLAWARWRGLALFARDGTWRGGLLAGLLFAGEFACIYVGLQFTSASRMTVFLYLSPFVVALGMVFVAPGERLTPRQLAGLVVAFAGVALAYAEGFAGAAGAPPAGPHQWLGDALGLAAALLWGLTTLAIRATRLATALPEKTLLWQLAVSGVALVAASVAAGEAWPARLSAGPAALLAFQTVVITFASYLTWFWLLRHYPATRLSAFTLLTPVFGLAAGVALLGEPATPRLLLALAAVCAGIALVNLPGRNLPGRRLPPPGTDRAPRAGPGDPADRTKETP
jgi:drug/metabolite transporter (DMT)-like permease